MENRPEPVNPFGKPEPIGMGHSAVGDMFDTANRILTVEQAKRLICTRAIESKYGKWLHPGKDHGLLDFIAVEVESAQTQLDGRTREDAKAMAQAEAGQQPAPMSVNMFTGESQKKK